MAESSEPGDDRPFLGRGWSFPPTFDRRVGGVQMLEHEADIVSSLHILLSTARGERTMVPQYGCNMDELVFENLDTRMRTLMADKIESAILYHEPRIDLERVQLDDDPSATLEGRVLIGVSYRVKATNSRFNFVFPYYRDEGTDINLTTTVQLLPDEP
jgi:Bacteriophage baseplate protein W